MVKEIVAFSPLIERYHKLQQEWEYIEEPTCSRSIGHHAWSTS